MSTTPIMGQVVLPNLADFLYACGVTMPGQVSDVYDALEAYHKPGGDKEGRLLVFYVACARWLKKHQKGMTQKKWEIKTEATLTRLRNDIEEAWNPSFRNAMTRYHQRKEEHGEKDVEGGFKKLSKGYNLERKTYLAKKKRITPFSASLLSNKVDNLENLSKGKYEKLGEENDTVRMYFCNRESRMRFLAQWVVDRWKDVHGQSLHTQMGYQGNPLGSDLECHMYAMDRYGNLFVAYDNAGFGQKVLNKATNAKREGREFRGGQFNHSSFCAGREIICAGTVFFWKGQLIHIDNSSGHYKPTRQNLWNAVNILVNDYYGGIGDAACSYLRVGLMGVGLFKAQSFLTNVQDPDWPVDDQEDGGQTDAYRNIPGFEY